MSKLSSHLVERSYGPQPENLTIRDNPLIKISVPFHQIGLTNLIQFLNYYLPQEAIVQ